MRLLIALNLVSVASVAFLWFVAIVHRRIGDRDDRFFSPVFLESAILYLATYLTGAAAPAAPAIAGTLFEHTAISQGGATVAVGTAAGMILVIGPRLQAVFMFTTSTLIVRTGAMPRRLGFFGYAAGMVLIAFPLILQPLGLAFPIWVLIVSVTLAVTRSGRPSDGTGRTRSGARHTAITVEVTPTPTRSMGYAVQIRLPRRASPRTTEHTTEQNGYQDAERQRPHIGQLPPDVAEEQHQEPRCREREDRKRYEGREQSLQEITHRLRPPSLSLSEGYQAQCSQVGKGRIVDAPWLSAGQLVDVGLRSFDPGSRLEGAPEHRLALAGELLDLRLVVGFVGHRP